MIYGYARASTDGQSVDAQVRQLTKAGCKKVFREVHASGAMTDRARLCRMLDQLEAGYVLTVTRLDRLARSTRGLLNTLAAITAKGGGFKFLAEMWADTITSHGQLMLTARGGPADVERDLIRARTNDGRQWEGARREARAQAEADAPQQREAAARVAAGESQCAVVRSYDVSQSAITRSPPVETAYR